MAKRRVKKNVKQSASSPSSNADGAGPRDPPIEKKEDAFRDQEVEPQIAAIRAIREMEIEHLMTGLRLLCSYFKDQLQTPVLQFFKENLPNLSVVRNGKGEQYEVQWKDRDGNVSMNQADERSLHASLLHRMSIAYPDCSAAMPSFGGFEFSSEAVKMSLLGADNLQIRDFVLEEPSNTQMIGLQDGLQTPGVSSQRLSVGMTPKTLRLPKHGEMLVSVHGSPLGVYKEDNLEAIHESE
uniref:Borealin C-terminal domain-containing protein n=2 Tax=Davidia involucrata TaxID=16924 RepID=A0A5B7ART7_DAVIN